MDKSNSELPDLRTENNHARASPVENPDSAPADISPDPLQSKRLGFDAVVLAVMLWFAANFLGQFGSQWVQSRLMQILLASSIANTLIVLALPRLLQVLSETPPDLLGAKNGRVWRHVGQGLLLAAIWGPLTFWLNATVRSYMPQTVPHPGETFLRTNHSAGEWLVFVYALCVAAPLAEELLFRGVLLGWLARRMGSAEAILASGLLFAMAHTTWPDQLPLAFLGVGLGLAYLRTSSLWAPIAMHAVFNLSNVAIGYLGFSR